ncbi:MAG TPA: hypothetical protein VEX86_01255 [Longimicrobium sp.]|nr:hypothetical protein [Longimicrobium sp.]
MSLNPNALVVESFVTAAAQPSLGIPTEPVPTTMHTHERDCTYPALCGGTY